MVDPLLMYRVYRKLWLANCRWAASLLYRLNRFVTSCDLPPTAAISERVRFRHWGIGVVVADGTTIASETAIYPKCRLLTKDAEKARVTVGRNVQLGACATIVAASELRIGNAVQVTAGTVLRTSVPDGKSVAGESVTTLPIEMRLPASHGRSPIRLYRLGCLLHRNGIKFLPGFIFRLNARINQSLIPPDVQIGRRVRLGFGVGLLTGTIVGDDVTIGAHVSVVRNVRRGKGLHAGRVIIGDKVIIGRDAVLIASSLLEIGAGARIQEGAIVTKSVPPGCTVAGVPARIVSPSGEEAPA